MTTDTILQIIQWLIPIGGLGSVMAWVVKRDTRKDRAIKEKNDIYKEMYDNLSGTLMDLQNENKKLYRAIARLERAVTRATTCRHYGDCPMRIELQDAEASHHSRNSSDAAGLHHRPSAAGQQRTSAKPPHADGPLQRPCAAQSGEPEPVDGQRG